MMKHELTRAQVGQYANVPACVCGYADPVYVAVRLLDGRERANIIARTAVLDHVDTGRDLPIRLPQPSDPFDVGAERAYPRAGVRRQPDGRWRLTLWDGPDTFHVMDAAQTTYTDRYSAFSLGWMLISEHRRNGTRLNGMAAA